MTTIGAQMYTLRDHCKTLPDIAKTCERLKAMGYGAVQVSALGPHKAEELAPILKDNGLVCAATHQKLEQMQDVSACVDYHQAIGCKYTAIGGFNGAGKPAQAWGTFVDDLNSAAAQLTAQGIRVGYHNHSHEWAPCGSEGAAPGNSGASIDYLIEKLSDDIWFEMDTYWVAHGGGDPAAWIDKVKGRIPCVHVKDMTITAAREQKMCEVGSGNLNWPAILDACKRAGVEWYLVERDSGDLDPFDSLEISLNNLKTMGLQ